MRVFFGKKLWGGQISEERLDLWKIQKKPFDFLFQTVWIQSSFHGHLCFIYLHYIARACFGLWVMHPSIWGPDTWAAIHYVALGYPLSDPPAGVKVAYAAFFDALGPVLPCGLCSKHYQAHLAQHAVEPALEGRDALFRWTVDLHNTVSHSIGKQSWTYEQAYTEYSGPQNQARARARALARSREATRGSVRSAGQVVAYMTLTLSVACLVAVTIWLLRKQHKLRMRL